MARTFQLDEAPVAVGDRLIHVSETSINGPTCVVEVTKVTKAQVTTIPVEREGHPTVWARRSNRVVGSGAYSQTGYLAPLDDPQARRALHRDRVDQAKRLIARHAAKNTNHEAIAEHLTRVRRAVDRAERIYDVLYPGLRDLGDAADAAHADVRVLVGGKVMFA